MNTYRLLGDHVGTNEARELAEQLVAWHDAMVRHLRVVGPQDEAKCLEDCPHEEAAHVVAYRAGYFRRESERPGLPAGARTCTSCSSVTFARQSGVEARMSLSRRLVIWPHHRDTLQLPAVDRWDPTPAEAMTWNIFRTLELMPPAFWLRRLNAFLGLAAAAARFSHGHSSAVGSAADATRLWCISERWGAH